MITVLKKTNLDIQLFISNDESVYNISSLYFGLIRKGYLFVRGSSFMSSNDRKSGTTYSFEKIKYRTTNNRGSNRGVSQFNWEVPFIKDNEEIGMQYLNIEMMNTEYLTLKYKIDIYKTTDFVKKFPELSNLNESLKDCFNIYNTQTPRKSISFVSNLNIHTVDLFSVKEDYKEMIEKRNRTTTLCSDFDYLEPNDKYFVNLCDKINFFENSFYLIYPFMYLKLLSYPQINNDCFNLSLNLHQRLKNYSNFLLNPVKTTNLDREKLIDLCSNFKRNNVINNAKAKIINIIKDKDAVNIYLFSKIPILKENTFSKFKYLNDNSFDFVASFLSQTDIYNALEVEIAKNIFINL